MKFYKYLYIGDTVKEPGRVKRRLKLHAGQMIYVVCLAQGDDQLAPSPCYCGNRRKL